MRYFWASSVMFVMVFLTGLPFILTWTDIRHGPLTFVVMFWLQIGCLVFTYTPLPVGLQTEDLDKPWCADADADVVLGVGVGHGSCWCWLLVGRRHRHAPLLTCNLLLIMWQLESPEAEGGAIWSSRAEEVCLEESRRIRRKRRESVEDGLLEPEVTVCAISRL